MPKNKSQPANTMAAATNAPPRAGIAPAVPIGPMGPIRPLLPMGPMNNCQMPFPFRAPFFLPQLLPTMPPAMLPPTAAHPNPLLTEPRQNPPSTAQAPKKPDASPAETKKTKHKKKKHKPLPMRKDYLKTKYKPASQKDLKKLLHGYFCSSTGISCRQFCDTHTMHPSDYNKLIQAKNKNPRLRELERLRDDEDKRNEAIAIIDKMLPGPNFKDTEKERIEAEAAAAKKAAAEEKKRIRSEIIAAAKKVSEEAKAIDDEFFSPKNMAKIASELDFTMKPRKTRTGDKVIQLHLDKDPNERVRTLILLLYKEVLSRHSGLNFVQKRKVLDDTAKIIMYDHGYRDAKGYTTLITRHEPRIIDYYKTGTGMTPIQCTQAQKKQKSEEEMALYEIWKQRGQLRGIKPGQSEGESEEEEEEYEEEEIYDDDDF